MIAPTPAQKKQWDQLLLRSNNAYVYGLSWYLDTVCGEHGWGLITNKEITTGLPIAFKKRWGYKNIYQPFYTMFFDVVNPIGSIDVYLEAIGTLYHHVHLTCQEKPLKFPSVNRIRQEMSMQNFDFKQSFSENAFRLIKKAQKSQLVFSTSTKSREVVNLFKKNKGKELKEYKNKHFTILNQLINECVKRKTGFCAHVEQDGEILAAGFFITFYNRIIFLKGAVNPKGKKNGAMYFLMHQVINQSKEIFNCFDFGGSNAKQVAEFYHKLGGKDVNYAEILIDQRTLLHKIIKKIT